MPAKEARETAPVTGIETTNTSTSNQGGARLDHVRQRGHIICGTTKVVAGYRFLNQDGEKTVLGSICAGRWQWRCSTIPEQ